MSRRPATRPTSLLKNAVVAFFNLAKRRAELAAARKVSVFQTLTLASPPAMTQPVVFQRAANLASSLVACWLLALAAGCNGSAAPQGAISPQEASAVASLNGMGAKTKVRDGRVVYVDFYGVSDAPAAAAFLKSLPQVERINFASTNLTDEGLAHAAELAELKVLALNRTKVTDNGLVHLAKLTKLEVLNLNEDEITDAGLARLGHLSELSQLHLNQTQVTDAGLKHLADLKKLQSLLVFGTPVSRGGASSFRQEHPNANVVITDAEEAKEAEEVEVVK